MHTTSTPGFLPTIRSLILELLDEIDLIPAARREHLRQLAAHIRSKRAEDQVVRLNFICTHNSRRSHLAQIWMSVAAAWFKITGIETFSGGTEATALNPRAVAALRRAGFQIDDPGGDNPHYRIRFSEAGKELAAWSKVYDDAANPAERFIAVMTCSDADENCPFIPGAELRFPLTYDDPKMADGTPEEERRYDERVREIGREMLFLAETATKPSPPVDNRYEQLPG
jgi:arsenate reductase